VIMGKYHDILGVDNTATPAQIKKAFHALSKKYHPDLNPDDKETEEKYKEISAAYNGLNNGDDGDDREKKAQDYAERHFRDSGFDEIMSGIMKGAFYSQQHTEVGKKGGNVRVPMHVPIFTLFRGGTLLFEGMIPSWTPRGWGYVPKSRKIVIEPNTPVGTQIVFTGDGSMGEDGSVGNLLIDIVAAPQGIYECDGLNLIVRGKIASTDAIIGKRKKFILPSGDEQEFDVPIGAQNNQVLVIPKKGLTGANGRVGNLVIVFELKTKILSEEKRKKLAELLEETSEETSSDGVRED